MSTIEDFFRQVEVELQRAREAKRIGNEGRVRTAARRAAGNAISALLLKYLSLNYGSDFMNQLRSMKEDEQVPREVRSAANRLQTRITQQFTSPFSTDPIEDALIIIEYVRKKIEAVTNKSN